MDLVNDLDESSSDLTMPQRVYLEAKKLVAEQSLTDAFLKK